VNPGVTRLVIVLALVAGGVGVLAKGFSGSAAADDEGPDTTSPSVSESPSPSQSPEQDIVGRQEGVLVQVLNGTFTPGFAGDWEIRLEDDGYLKAGDPADSPDKPIVDSVVYFRPDDSKEQNQADAQLLAETYLKDAPAERLPEAYKDIVDPAADVIVVLGEDAPQP
jgi:LytR cell envelope-related transcriptional attenuator